MLKNISQELKNYSKVFPVLAKKICIPLTDADCINSSISNGQFPIELKMTAIIPNFK